METSHRPSRPDKFDEPKTPPIMPASHKSPTMLSSPMPPEHEVEQCGGLYAENGKISGSPPNKVAILLSNAPGGPGLTGWRTDQIAMALLTAALLAVVMVSYAKYGFTTDETWGVARARRVYAFLSSAGSDSRIASSSFLIYGAAPDVLALLLQKLAPRLSYDARHLVFASFGVVGIFSSTNLAAHSYRPGPAASLLYSWQPRRCGSATCSSTKDIPFAAMLIASSYYSLVALTSPETRLLWLKLGVTIGLLATIKIVGILIFGFVVVVFLGCFMMFPGEHKVALNRAFVHRAAAVAAAALGGILVSPYYSGRNFTCSDLTRFSAS